MIAALYGAIAGCGGRGAVCGLHRLGVALLR